MGRRDKDIDDEDLIDNMGDILEDTVIHINKKDPSSIVLINKYIAELQSGLVESCKEIIEADEFDQDDLIDLASKAMLLATSMGIPPDDNEETPATENTPTSNEPNEG